MKRLAFMGSVAALGLLAGMPPAAMAASSLVAADAAQRVTFDVYMPLHDLAALQTLLVDLQTPSSPNYHRWLTPAQFNARFGPTAQAMSVVETALTNQGFSITAVLGRRISVAGTAGQVSHSFATTLSRRVSGSAIDVIAREPMILPAALKAAGVYIPNFTGAPPAQVDSQPVMTDVTTPGERRGPAGPFWFDDLKQAYGYPSYQAYDGSGVDIAVMIAGNALDSDIAKEFDHERFTAITGKPAPRLAARVNASGVALPADAAPIDEASLDVQEILGGAPGAAVTLVDIPSLSNADILAGYTYIVQQVDKVGRARFKIVNSSFGQCELYYTAGYPGASEPYPQRQDELFMQGNAEGITFVASSGDEGALYCPSPNYYETKPTGPSRFVASINMPAASPHVTAVGGTNLLTSYTTPNGPAVYAAENTNGDPEEPYDPGERGILVAGGYWGAGGGMSDIFAKPASQELVQTGSATARTTPDVGMEVGGCPAMKALMPCGPNRSSVWIVVSGRYLGEIGTSNSSPEFVSALALYVQKQGGVGQGDMNPYLYAKAAAQNAAGPIIFNRYIPGFDGKYPASYPNRNYNYMVGNGTPHVADLFGLGSDLAGAPQTPTNP